jgi:hypothetical protein
VRRTRWGSLATVVACTVAASCGGGGSDDVVADADLTIEPAPVAAPAGEPADVDAAAGGAQVAWTFHTAIDTVTAADLGASWRPGCPVGPESLRRLTVTYWGFDGPVHEGELIVHQDHARALADVFSQLYAAGYPIEQIRPVSEFGADDDASMAANNTSAFNCRAVTGGTGWSEHSYGWALDLNPVQNPYVRGSNVLPPAGRDHLDRSPAPGRITAGDVVVQAFAGIGWAWGGDWSTFKDYQHFSATGR